MEEFEPPCPGTTRGVGTTEISLETQPNYPFIISYFAHITTNVHSQINDMHEQDKH